MRKKGIIKDEPKKENQQEITIENKVSNQRDDDDDVMVEYRKEKKKKKTRVIIHQNLVI